MAPVPGLVFVAAYVGLGIFAFFFLTIAVPLMRLS
jgi:hypothetical protein